MTDFDYKILAEHFTGDELKNACHRVENGEPLAYVIGEWYFYGETFRLNKDCLIPRPDTEHVVDRLISLLPQNAYFADLCCGSGCIAISVLLHRPDCHALSVDISPGALEAARFNAQNLGVSDRTEFICADICMPDFLCDKTFDIIAANPPYIASSVIDTLSVQVLCEPRIALDGGTDGLDFYRVLLSKYLKYIKKGGSFIFEIGYDQGEAIRSLASPYECDVFRDYGGCDRVAVIKLT